MKKTKVMRISRQTSPTQATIHQEQLENMEYFNYFGSMITNDARCTSEIKSRTATAKGALNSNMTTLFTSKPDLKLKEETSNVLHLEHSFAQY